MAPPSDPRDAVAWESWLNRVSESRFQNPKKAAGSLYEALATREKDLPANTYAWIHETLGKCEIQLGYITSAKEHLMKADRDWQVLGDKRHLADTRKAVGDLYIFVGDFAIAEKYYRQAVEIYWNLNEPREAHAVLVELGWVKFREHKYLEALAIFDRVIAFSEKKREKQYFAGTHDRRGSVLAALGRYKEAEDAYKKNLEQRESSVQRAIGYGNLGALYYQWGKYDQSIASCHQSLALLSNDANLETRLTDHWILGKVFRAQGKLEESQIEMNYCLEDLLALRRGFGDQAEGYAFLDTAFQFVEDYLATLWACQKANPDGKASQDAFYLQDQIRAMGLLSRSMIWTFTSNSPDQYRPTKPAADSENSRSRLQRLPVIGKIENPTFGGPAKFISQVRDLLTPGDCVAAYIAGREHVYFWVLGKRQLDFFQVPIEIKAFDKNVAGLLQTMAVPDPGSSRSRSYLGKQFVNQWLPFLGSRPDIERLIVLPDGPLHLLPFEALPDPQMADSLLIDRCEVVYLPSLAFLLQRERVIPVQSRKIAAFGDPIFNLQDRRLNESSPPGSSRISRPPTAATDLQRLPSTAEEITTLKSLCPAGTEVQTFLGAEASREQLLRLSHADFWLFHFATHGFFNVDEPQLSGIYLSNFDQKRHPIEGIVRAYDLDGVQFNASLVVLSGCQTALGRYYRAEGIVGLGRAFFDGGAGALLASRWRVRDECTTAYMKYFYEALFQEGKSLGAANRRAQQRMFRETDWREPFFWSAFQFQGDWRQKF